MRLRTTTAFAATVLVRAFALPAEVLVTEDPVKTVFIITELTELPQPTETIGFTLHVSSENVHIQTHDPARMTTSCSVLSTLVTLAPISDVYSDERRPLTDNTSASEPHKHPAVSTNAPEPSSTESAIPSWKISPGASGYRSSVGTSDSADGSEHHESSESDDSFGHPKSEDNSSSEGTFSDDDENSHPPTSVDAPDPFPRLKKAKHWRIGLPLLAAFFPFFGLALATPIYKWLRLGGHRQHPQRFFDVLRHGPRERHRRREEEYGEGREEPPEREEKEKIMIQLRIQELEDAAVARGDQEAIARRAEREREAAQRALTILEATRRTVSRQRRAMKAEARRQRELAAELSDEERAGEITSKMKEEIQTLTVPEYHSAMAASISAKVRRRTVVPSPIDPPVPAERIWVP